MFNSCAPAQVAAQCGLINILMLFFHNGKHYNLAQAEVKCTSFRELSKIRKSLK